MSGFVDWFRSLFDGGTVIPVVRLQGVIASDQRAGRLNIAGVAPLLKRAFSVGNAPAVALVVNSPGGSAVQSRLIAKRIRDLAREKDKRVLVFVEDAAASGGYFIATAGDEIIADPSSIVGSIGVIAASFGLEAAIAKLGVTRRVYTAGRNKSTLDPFLPEKPEDIERVKQAGEDIHRVFIDYVKERRGGRLKAPDETLFTGEWWTGVKGLELGLIDSIGDIHSVLTERYGDDVRLRPIAQRRGFFNFPALPFMAVLDGGAFAASAVAAIEDRIWWSRLGL